MNGRAVLIDVMIEGGLLPFLGELVVNERDTLVLVCFSFCSFINIFIALLNLAFFGVCRYSFLFSFLSICSYIL